MMRLSASYVPTVRTVWVNAHSFPEQNVGLKNKTNYECSSGELH